MIQRLESFESNYPAFIEVLYAVIVGESLFVYGKELFSPFLVSTWALVVTYMAIISSWLFWHAAVKLYSHNRIGRFIIDIFVLVTYLLIVLDHSNLYTVFFGFVFLYAFFLVWSIFTKKEQNIVANGIRDSSLNLIFGTLISISWVLLINYTQISTLILNYLFLIILATFIAITQGRAIKNVMPRETHKTREETKQESDKDALVEKGAFSIRGLEAQRLLSTLSSRENSTLVVSTVAASVSITILAIRLESPSNEWFLLSFLIGFLFSFLGFLYRELTIHGIDEAEYKILNSISASSRAVDKKYSLFHFLRAVIIRILFLIPTVTWIYITFTELTILTAVICGVACFCLSFYDTLSVS